MSKTETKRVKKRAAPSPQPADNDLLATEPAPQVPVVPNPEEAVTTTAVEKASPASSVAPEEKTPLAEAAAALAEQDAPKKALSAGAILKAAREAAGLSIDDVSRLLKLASRQIQALEQDNFDALPPRTFVRGFIRNYARLLNIDAGAVLEALPPEDPHQTVSLAASSVKKQICTMPAFPPYGKKASQTWKGLSIAAVLVVVVAAVFFFWPHLMVLFSESDTSQTAPDAAISAVNEEANSSLIQQEGENGHTLTPIISPLPEAPADSVPAPTDSSADPSSRPVTESVTPTPANSKYKEAELVLHFTGDSWAEVRDRSGKILYSALAKGGDEQTLAGVPPFSLVLGNSNVVTVMLRGEPVNLNGQSKQGVARLTLE